MTVGVSITRARVLRGYFRRASVGYPFPDSDVHWTHRNSVKYPLICVLAGVAAGRGRWAGWTAVA
jgi:hypothetical protein